MNPLHALRRLVSRHRRSDEEIAEEMRFHLHERAADLRDEGLSEEEARYAAQRKFGNLGSIQEQAREIAGLSFDRLRKDILLGLRQLLRSPGFSVLAIVTLALGIGANTAMFSVLDAILLRPLPYPGSEQLDAIYRSPGSHSINPLEGGISAPEFAELSQQSTPYRDLAAFAYSNVSFADPGQPPDVAKSIRITTDFFATLRMRPQLGRDFAPGEDSLGNHRVVLISDHCWKHRFGARRDVIGHTVRVDGEPHVILGVMPPALNDWRHLGWVEVFRPLSLKPGEEADRTDRALRVIGRRREGVSPEEARTFIQAFGARLAQDHPDVNGASTWHTMELNKSFLGKTGPTALGLLMGLSGFVLLIACTNLANLFLARTVGRARELAVRSALGASRLQLLRPLVAEALILAFAGGSAAVVVAVQANHWFNARSMGESGENAQIVLNWLILGWAIAASIVTAVVFALGPALFALRLDVNSALKNGARGATGGRSQQRFRHTIIIGQFALAMVLLSGAAVFIRAVRDLNERRYGWESNHLVTGDFALPASRYTDAEKITAFHRDVVSKLTTLPGVASVSVSAYTPFFTWYDVRPYTVEGREPAKPGQEPSAAVNHITPSYFDTVGTRILSGRRFTDSDSASSPKVFIINQSMAAALFGEEDPIGRRLAQTQKDTQEWGEIVGIAADTQSVAPDRNPKGFQLYVPFAQEPGTGGVLAVRSSGELDPESLIGAIRSAMTSIDPDLPVNRLLAADTAILRATDQMRILRDMLGSFAVLGLGLAALGVFGVISRTTAQRTNEFAIRYALGASPGEITRLVLKSGLRLAGWGAAVGLLGAAGLSKLLAAGFPGMKFEGAPAVLAVTLLLTTVALMACWLPSRRAGRIDPASVLRSE